jgi:hypothetical protein
MLNLDLSYTSSLVRGCLNRNPTQPQPASRCFPGTEVAPCAHRAEGKKVREIEASGCAVLACHSCGEWMVLLGGAGDWYREGRSTFACGGCGRELTLANRVGEVRLDTTDLYPSPR